jgi:asparagine synthase (glutamine-hydrolysing)
MCGIVGVALRRSGETRWLESAARALAHRGPDGDGFWSSADGRVAFGHRRLAIRDISSAGAQPFEACDGRFILTFNGEIYNYTALRAELEAAGYDFRTDCDTEALVLGYHKWGEAVLDRMVGMFAFVLYDRDQNLLFGARDRAGEKPFFYALDGDGFRFGSELKALRAYSGARPEIDPVSLDSFLAMGYVPGAACIVKGAAKLPPAHCFTLDLESFAFTVRRYWDLPAPPPADDAVDEAALVDELDDLLTESVARMLEADVPLGVLLSGGVDSSLVVALAAKSGGQVNSVTIGFADGTGADERPHAALIASAFGTQHHELVAEPATADLLPLLARHYDEPIIDSSMIPTYLVSRMVRGHCTVALGGDGGDELFGGYGHYSRLLWMESRPGRFPLALRRGIASAAGSLPQGFKGRNWLRALGTDFHRTTPLIANYFDVAERDALIPGLLGAGFDPAARAERALAARMPNGGDLLGRATRMDFANYLPEDILVKVDRASMANSLELRAPFLDHRIIEFAFGRVPSRLKASPHARKILLKALARRYLPQSFDSERKQGFGIPMAQWLRGGPFLDLVTDVLRDSGSIFDQRAIAAMLDGQARGRNNGERIFGLTMLQLWINSFDVSVGDAR